MKKLQVQTSFYISQEIRDLVNFLYQREELTKIVFYRRAIKYYFEVDGEVDPSILITEKSHPDYIRRDVLETIKIDVDLKEQIEQLAKEKHYTEAQIIFMALIDYCAMLLSIDSTGVTIEE